MTACCALARRQRNQGVIVSRDPPIGRHDRSEPTDPVHWWRATPDVQDTVYEILGLINTSLGFAVKPGS